MPLRAARARRKAALRLVSSTACQSASLSRSASMSRVMPALLTRMSTGSAAATSASAAAASAMSPVWTSQRSPSAAASSSSASRRRPARTTWQPWACRPRAMAPPMPPEAPVTSARRPERSNMVSRHPRPAARPAPRRPPGSWTLTSAAPGTPRLARPVSTLPAPSSITVVDAEPGHGRHALAPAHARGHLPHQQLADGRRVLHRLGGDVGDHRHRRERRTRSAADRLRQPLGGGLHQRAMEGCGDLQHDAAPGAALLGQRHRALDGGGRCPR